MNSFVNPVIYTIFNPEFRKAFKKIMHIEWVGRIGPGARGGDRDDDEAERGNGVSMAVPEPVRRNTSQRRNVTWS